MSFAERYRRAALFVANLLVLGTVLNLLAWAALAVWDRWAERTNPVSRKYGSDLTAYYPGLSAAEINEMLRVTWSLPSLYAPFTGRKLGPVTSRFVNIAPEGHRLGREPRPWPPERDRHRVIFFLGGSTALGFGVRDADTIPSQLQDLLATRGGSEPPAVYNLGIPANTSTTERIQFQQLLAAGQVPEVVVFLDGYNDRAPSHDPPGTPQIEQVLNTSRFQQARWLGLRTLVQTPLVRLLSRTLHASGRRHSPIQPAGAPAAELAQQVVERYLANVAMSGAIAERFGIEALFVWQPVPEHGLDPARFPFDDLTRPEAVTKRAVHEHMAARFAAGGLDPRLLDCSHLNAEATPDAEDVPLYVDVAHYSAAMSLRIARCIAARLALPAGAS